MRRRFIHLAIIASCLIAMTMPGISWAASSVPESFADLVEKLTPAVVNISTTQKIKNSMGLPGMEDPMVDERLRDFLERFMPPGAMPFGTMPQQEREVFSLGSGFIIDAEGYVVTNNHVIGDAEEIKVILSDNTQLPASVIGKDAKTDLALLKVTSEKKLPFVKWGNSSKARVGDWVIAIGNPFGLGGTVTAGIISARSRNINAGPFDDFIQTDASINRGNSGGPLFNAAGEVIGVNTAIFSPNGGSIGIGFAAPEEIARTVISQLREHGRTFRGWLGVQIQSITDEMAESMGMKKAKGALVMEVSKDSPSEKAGIKVGDVILQFDGKKIDEMRGLPRIVAETEIGKTVEVFVLRHGEKKTLSVKVGELKEDVKIEAKASSPKSSDTTSTKTHKFQGLTLAEIDEILRTRFSIDAKEKGLIVLDVNRNSEAAKQGFTRGDIVTQVQDQPITSVADFSTAVEDAKTHERKNVLLRVLRKDSNAFLTLPTMEKKNKKN